MFLTPNNRILFIYIFTHLLIYSFIHLLIVLRMVKITNVLLLFTFMVCSGFTWKASHDAAANDIPEMAPDTTYLRLETRIAEGNNDVEENGLTGDIYFNSTDLELCHDRGSTGNQAIGLRFTTIFLPPGAEITKAYIQFTADESVNIPGMLTISGEDSADSEPFQAEPYDVSARPRTYASIEWMPNNWQADESTALQRTADISEIVQEIVNKSDFTGMDFAMTFVIEGEGKHIAKAYELNPQAAPMLYVEYDY